MAAPPPPPPPDPETAPWPPPASSSAAPGHCSMAAARLLLRRIPDGRRPSRRLDALSKICMSAGDYKCYLTPSFCSCHRVLIQGMPRFIYNQRNPFCKDSMKPCIEELMRLREKYHVQL